jgi:hypothetical protein
MKNKTDNKSGVVVLNQDILFFLIFFVTLNWYW